MRFNARFYALLSGAALTLGPAAAQTERAAPARPAAAAQAASQFTNSPREKLVVAMPKTYAKAETMLLWGDYFNHLARCGNVDLQNQQGESLEKSTNIDVLGEKELIDSLLTGKAQLAQVNPGLVPQLVGAGQPAPFGVPGNKASGKRNSYTLILISRVDSPFKEPKDLIGKKIAHSTPTSNSGNLAPRALFPAIGLVPDQNYEVVFSNGHERSVTGVMHGFYPAAAVASDLYQRMVVKGDVKGSSIRTLWESPPFMTETWTLGKDVSPELQARVKKCSYSYSFSPKLRQLLPGNDTFLPINFERDFSTVMEVYNKTQKAAQAAKSAAR
ncbi:PhnD/SsuA/transferrin family substrate-binding protein [Acidovorax sp. NB1]|uniref:PhnD/SsuA/transferrin family substrate-binding protein n=1 Tax=Acidovorax sp. NB1 TaxID=1943571 RepID=UPI0010F06695|nr:PhnD/SsuA/transferrin family substrate-binding protein [Acidovorax sp. NB1]GDY35459.1 phosphonate ABC transporter substrate-binding protein [Acidovorax sp. NB1]